MASAEVDGTLTAMGVHEITPEPSDTTSHDCSAVKPHRTLAQRLNTACLHLPPSFFSINMGTGVVSILLYNYPYQAHWLRILGIIVFVLNVVVFLVLLAATVIRYVRWRGVFSAVRDHFMAGLFWGCLPMGMTTIVNMVAFVCVPAWGLHWARLALGLWWINVVLSMVINLGMVFVLFTRHAHTLQSVSPNWLLPIVTSVVASASGAVVATALAPFDPALARSTAIAAYVVWGTGVPSALLVIALVMLRFALHGPPLGAAIASAFLPLGPCGQGSYGIITLGTIVRTLAYDYDVGFGTESIRAVADAVYAGGLVAGLVLWGLGLVWYILAFAMMLDTARKDWTIFTTGFTVSFWALTFPIGVFGTATIALAHTIDSPAFRVFGAIIAAQVCLHWLYVSTMTLWKCWQGTWFAAPELDGFTPVRRWAGASDAVEKV